MPLSGAADCLVQLGQWENLEVATCQRFDSQVRLIWTVAVPVTLKAAQTEDISLELLEQVWATPRRQDRALGPLIQVRVAIACFKSVCSA